MSLVAENGGMRVRVGISHLGSSSQAVKDKNNGWELKNSEKTLRKGKYQGVPRLSGGVLKDSRENRSLSPFILFVEEAVHPQ